MRISFPAVLTCVVFLAVLALCSWLHFHDSKAVIVTLFATVMVAWLGHPWWKGAFGAD